MSNSRPFAGTIGYVGRPTIDGRTLTRVDWSHLPLPVLTRGGDVIRVGLLETIDRRPTGEIVATGHVEGLEPGRYDVGLDVRIGSDAAPDAAEFPGTILALTVWTSGAPGDASAWTDPDAMIEVR